MSYELNVKTYTHITNIFIKKRTNLILLFKLILQFCIERLYNVKSIVCFRDFKMSLYLDTRIQNPDANHVG